MHVVCLDLEGVLVPEIWIEFSKATQIPELMITTRDEPDYDKLMKFRIGILERHGLKLKDNQLERANGETEAQSVANPVLGQAHTQGNQGHR